MLTLRELYEAAENWRERRRIHAEILKMERSKRKIILVAGHHRAGFWHRKDPGALCKFEDTCEHYECEKIVYQAKQLLERDGFTVAVLPFDLNIPQKIKFINKNFTEDDLLFSVHLNSYRNELATGTETFIAYYGEEELIRNAKEVQKIMVKTLGLSDRGVKFDYQSKSMRLAILRDTIVEECYLLELGFISNKDDFAVVQDRGALAVKEAAKAAFYW